MSNTILDNYDELPDRLKVISSYDLNADHAEEAWKSQVQDAAEGCFADKAAYDMVMREREQDILLFREEHGENVRTKKGKLIFGKVTQKPDGTRNSTYWSNKAIIGNAIDAGIDLLEGDKPVPKSRLEKTIKEAKEATKPENTPFQRAIMYAGKLKNVWHDLDITEKDEILAMLGDLN